MTNLPNLNNIPQVTEMANERICFACAVYNCAIRSRPLLVLGIVTYYGRCVARGQAGSRCA